MKRRAVASLEERKLALISGIWSNEGFNDDKGTREEALDNLEEQFKKAERLIFLGPKEQKRQADLHRFTKEDEENPFLRPAIEATRRLDTPRDDEGSVKQVVKEDGYEIDQE